MNAPLLADLPAVGLRESRPSPWKNSLIPCAKRLAVTLRIITARGLTDPSLMQKFGAQLSHGCMLLDLNVTEKTEALADGAGGSEFAGGQSHEKFRVSQGEIRLAAKIIVPIVRELPLLEMWEKR